MYPGTVQATVATPQFLYISGPTAQMCVVSNQQPAPNMCTYPVPSTLPQDNNAEIAEVTVINNQPLTFDLQNPSASPSFNLVTDYPQSQLENVLGTEDSHSVLDVFDCSGANCSNTMANPVGNTNNVPTQCDLQKLYVLSGGAYGCPPPPTPPPPPPPPPPDGSGGGGLNGSSGSGSGSGSGDGSGSGGGGSSVYLLYTTTITIDISSDGNVSGSITEQTTYYYSDGTVSVGNPKYYTYGVCSTWGY